jgi:cytochrome c-type biogenesis protein CcmH
MAPVFAADVAEDPLERRMLEIARDLRCTVCQNQPVSESNSDLARDMRAIISEQLAAGKSRQEIVDYFVARYGNYVLMKPAFDQSGQLLWIAPVLLLAGMAVGAWVFVRNRRQVDLPPIASLSEEDRKRVKAAEAADQVREQEGDDK